MTFAIKALLPVTYLACSAVGLGSVTFVDNDSLGLARYDGNALSIPSAGSGGSGDDNWLRRTGFANGGSVLTSSESSTPEDAPMLLITVSGLTPNASYNTYGYFWSNSDSWRLKGSVDLTTVNSGTWPSSGDGNQNILDDGTPGDLTDDFLDNDVAVSFSRAGSGTSTAGTSLGSLDTTADGLADSYFSTGTVMVTEGNRTMYEAGFGTATTNGSGELVLLIDDLRDQTTGNNRTWFDGVGYELVPEPSSTVLLGLAIPVLVRRRRD